MSMYFRRFPLAVLAFAAASGVGAPALAAPALEDFFAAAVCQPPYSVQSATDLYDAAETFAKPDTSTMGAAIYRLPKPVTRDGFTTQDAVFAGSAVGVLIDGEVAAKLAERYHLTQEEGHMLGASSLGFSRVLPDDQQQMKEFGLVSLVARQGPALNGKTLLACEFVSNEDRAALEELNKLVAAHRRGE
ncbi:hypothetical protein [Novosphingobium sp. 9]|uniref:hypothetical protein n=1 Tax=Novosphingobium sp. 9 TaxID=2025349 RepID=UPI0021B6A23B|nr:hypothetical protein [Novosphingobium sp. 9]